jgi:hypothetical protein
VGGTNWAEESNVTSAELQEHEDILNRAVALLSEDSRVLGIYLAGSFAMGSPDKWSDIDLYIIVANGEVDGALQRHHDVFGKVRPLLTLFPATHLGDPHQSSPSTKPRTRYMSIISIGP